MVISTECMVAQTNACLMTAVDMLPVSQLIGVNTNLNNVPYAVACLAALPLAECNVGRFVYVTDIGSYRFSDGVSWTRDFVGTVPISNLLTWGNNSTGDLGNGTTVTRISPDTIAGGYDQSWCAVSAGSNVGALKTNSTLWTWGVNLFGQLGDGTTINRSSPGTTIGGATNWCKISFGASHVGAIKTDGTLWTWGRSTGGRLGDNSVIGRCSPGTTAGGGTTWCSVSAGYQHTTAVKTDGTLWLWGCNNVGQLGDLTVIDKSSPITASGGGTTWCTVSAGYKHTTAVKTDGTLWTWGCNTFGQLGDTTTTNRSSPGTTSGGGSNWCALASGAYNRNSGGVKTDGTLWTWGCNTCGPLGDGGVTARSSPGTTSGGGTSWCMIASAESRTGAIKTDGTLWTWGYNSVGILGDGTTINRSSPGTTAGGITSWCAVGFGNLFATGIFQC